MLKLLNDESTQLIKGTVVLEVHQYSGTVYDKSKSQLWNTCGTQLATRRTSSRVKRWRRRSAWDTNDKAAVEIEIQERRSAGIHQAAQLNQADEDQRHGQSTACRLFSTKGSLEGGRSLVF